MTHHKEPTYGVEITDGNGTDYYLGEDEILWDWANAPISAPFIDDVASVPLPEGYVVGDTGGEDRVVKGTPAGFNDTTLISSEFPFEDKAYILTCSMTLVSLREFNAAGLSDERIIRTSAF